MIKIREHKNHKQKQNKNKQRNSKTKKQISDEEIIRYIILKNCFTNFKKKQEKQENANNQQEREKKGTFTKWILRLRPFRNRILIKT